MLIGIAYNQPQPRTYGEEKDNLSEQAVLEEVSDVQQALKDLDYHVALLPLKDNIIHFIQKVTSLNPDLIFNLCESVYSQSLYEMNLPSLFELMKIPFTGSPPLALGICLDKMKTKYILLGADLPTPKFTLVSNIQMKIPSLSFPLIVKPSREDASIGISQKSVVIDKSSLKDRIDYIVTKYNQPALIESFIDGREINVSLIGNDSPKMLSISEIDFSKLSSKTPKIVTYHGKWDENSREFISTPVICPAKLNDSLKEKITDISKKAYKILGCRGYIRIDFRITHNNEPYIIDVNPNPDISKKAGFARSAEKSDITYNQLIQKIVNLALHSELKKFNHIELITIRKITKEDAPRLNKIIKNVGTFKEAEIKVAEELINNYLEKPENHEYLFNVADYGILKTVGYVCFGPTPLTQKTYDIYWIVVDRRFQNLGIGGKLLEFTENSIKKNGGKKIIIETSSRQEYAHARSLYKKTGYKKVASILNFYSPNDHKVIYEKDLTIFSNTHREKYMKKRNSEILNKIID